MLAEVNPESLSVVKPSSDAADEKKSSAAPSPAPSTSAAAASTPSVPKSTSSAAASSVRSNASAPYVPKAVPQSQWVPDKLRANCSTCT